MHVTEAVLEPLRRRYGDPALLEWEGEITAAELALATYNPLRTHDVTLFVLDPADRIALIRKPHFAQDIWRPPGGGIKPGEDFEAGAVREALEETGLRVRLVRYLVVASALFSHGQTELAWKTHVFLARTDDVELAPDDSEEIADARWGTLDELGGPLRARLLATGRALWRYRVALHDAALAAMSGSDMSGSDPDMSRQHRSESDRTAAHRPHEA
jgi:ADP-ribose pyrophosphatase YjhB (NUDIX family)